jgi:hypothetical protein
MLLQAAFDALVIYPTFLASEKPPLAAPRRGVHAHHFLAKGTPLDGRRVPQPVNAQSLVQIRLLYLREFRHGFVLFTF